MDAFLQTEEEKLLFDIDHMEYNPVNKGIPFDPVLDRIIKVLDDMGVNEEYETISPTTDFSLKRPKETLNSAGIILKKIPWIDEDVQLEMQEIMQKKYFSPKEFIDYLNSNIQEIDPFDLPIGLCETTSASFSHLTKSVFYYPHPNPDISYMTTISQPVFFKAIYVGFPYHQNTSSMIAHEIGHTQVESTKGLNKDYFLQEFIPIFFEKIASMDDVESFRRIERTRLQNLRTCINALRKTNTDFVTDVKVSKYIKSTLLAETLFFMYTTLDKKSGGTLCNDLTEVLRSKPELHRLRDFIGDYCILTGLHSEDVITHNLKL